MLRASIRLVLERDPNIMRIAPGLPWFRLRIRHMRVLHPHRIVERLGLEPFCKTQPANGEEAPSAKDTKPALPRHCPNFHHQHPAAHTNHELTKPRTPTPTTPEPQHPTRYLKCLPLAEPLRLWCAWVSGDRVDDINPA